MKNLMTGKHGAGGTADKNASNIEARSLVARNMVKDVQSNSTKIEARMGNRKTEARPCQKVDSLIREILSSKKPLRTRGKSWTCRWKQLCLVKSGKQSARKLAPGLILGNQNMHASQTPTNPPGSVWRKLNLKIMKITLPVRESIH